MSDDEQPQHVNMTDDEGQIATGLGKEDKETPRSIQSAVALKHEEDSKQAPTIVASGRGAVAEQILQLAFANDVRVREDAELVEILSYIDIDTPIPIEAFSAVAEILAYVYKANREQRGSV